MRFITTAILCSASAWSANHSMWTGGDQTTSPDALPPVEETTRLEENRNDPHDGFPPGFLNDGSYLYVVSDPSARVSGCGHDPFGVRACEGCWSNDPCCGADLWNGFCEEKLAERCCWRQFVGIRSVFSGEAFRIERGCYHGPCLRNTSHVGRHGKPAESTSRLSPGGFDFFRLLMNDRGDSASYDVDAGRAPGVRPEIPKSSPQPQPAPPENMPIPPEDVPAPPEDRPIPPRNILPKTEQQNAFYDRWRSDGGPTRAGTQNVVTLRIIVEGP